MSLANVRDYLSERLIRIKTEQKIYSKVIAKDLLYETVEEAINIKRLYHGNRQKLTEEEQRKALQSEYDKIKQSLKLKNLDKREPFEYFTPLDLSNVPEEWKPKPGIEQLPFLYHQGRTVTTTDKTPETGFPLHPRIRRLIYAKYPGYISEVYKYCRPLGTTISTFNDFNKEQKPSTHSADSQHKIVLGLVTEYLAAKPYLPLHFVDVGFAKLPLNTGTGYHNRHSFKVVAHAKFSHPEDYANKPTSKGYFLNAFLENARTLVHYIKQQGVPYPFDVEKQGIESLEEILKQFFNEYPTLLFTRNHISKIEGPLKQRPVYAVDDLFLYIETMLTFPLLTQARKMECCIMYGLETIRGANAYLDNLAQYYTSYFTIDWSSFDQTLPRFITDSYYMDFIPSLLVCNRGYTPTYEYPTHFDLEPDRMYTMLKNLLEFLHLWYNNMTFLSLNGFAYKRTLAGLPSGMLNTQYLDSYCNLYVLIDALLAFGETPASIKQIKLFIMGDDNSGFTHWPLAKTEEFVSFLEHYAKERWNMTLSKSKSITTDNRGNIETLSYQCNYGLPKKDVGKLLAQLCYPEHGYIDRYMSMRAVGIAYAACGIDEDFHNFCQDIYLLFLPDAEPLTPEVIAKAKKYLPGQFNILDDPTKYLDISQFPTRQQVVDEVRSWKGPLHFDPKWNYAHFIHPPDWTPPGSKTLATTRKEKDEMPLRPPTLT